MPRLVKVAIACGAIPLFAGTTIYFTWRLTRWNALELLGLINILAGLAFFLVGIGCLVVQVFRERRTGHPMARVATLRNTFAIGLLFANFPAAAVYGISAIDVMSRFTARVVNDSGEKIDALELKGIGKVVQFNPIPVGGRTRRYVRHFGEGSVEFTARQRDGVIRGELWGYVCGGEDITLRFLPGGKFEVHDNRDVEYLTRE